MRKTPLEMTRKNAIKLMNGDNLELLKGMPDNCVDAIVSDPPYGLSFMNKKWDHDVPSVEFWKEIYRVLKPGGHVLSFGGTRTYHRMVVNIEDAGFEIRDQIMWLYGSGFPKSHNIGKSVDKIQGSEREVVGTRKADDITSGNMHANNKGQSTTIDITKGTSEWEGWGTALKPANEPICVARKPLSEKNIAENVLKWGTGGINIDGCRIGFRDEADKDSAKPGSLNATGEHSMFGLKSGNEQNEEGRFPANVILECTCDQTMTAPAPKSGHWPKGSTKGFGEFGGGESSYEGVGEKETGTIDIHTDPNCPCYQLDKQTGILQSGKMFAGQKTKGYDGPCMGKFEPGQTTKDTYGDKGGASRFFYVAKVSKKERNAGLEDFEDKQVEGKGHGLDRVCDQCGAAQLKPCDCENNSWVLKPKKNHHPTVKPTKLMAYLCRLVTPPQGLILDPFMGSGSTGIAAIEEGFRFAGMELDPEYFEIAKARVEYSYKKTYENGK